MKYGPKISRVATLITRLSMILVILMVTSGFERQSKALSVGQIPDNLKAILTDYSQHLNSGKTSHPSFYSSPMEALIKNRRDFYNEFFSTGLHTNLTTINSDFHVDTATLIVTSNTNHIVLLETVTMFGYPIINQADDYPMISAARWAISNTDDESVKQALERYIDSTTYGVNDSISNGVQIVFRVYHSIDIENKKGQSKIIKDEFTDKEIDNGNGDDNVTWSNGNPVRSKPDLTQMPDYTIYHTPVNTLGKQLLEDYTKAYGGTSALIPDSVTTITYGRTSASNYARTYSSNTSLTTCSGIFQDTSKYNQLAAYKSIWQYTGCNDCADFVSQALRQGSFPTDTNWNYTPSPGKYAWRVFDFSTTPGLGYYLQTTLGVITVYASSTSLQLGDLAYTDGLHVVMVTGVSPVRYSGHTNDRQDHSWDSSLNHYWHIHDTIGG